MEANIGQRVRRVKTRGQGGGRGRQGQGCEEVREGGGEGRGEVGLGRRRRQGRGRRRGVRYTITGEISATVVDHIVNHGMSMREAGQWVQPNLSHYTDSCIHLDISK